MTKKSDTEALESMTTGAPPADDAKEAEAPEVIAEEAPPADEKRQKKVGPAPSEPLADNPEWGKGETGYHENDEGVLVDRHGTRIPRNSSIARRFYGS